MKQNLVKLTVMLGFLLNAACSSVNTNKAYVETDDYMARPSLQADIMDRQGKYLNEKEVKSLLSKKVNFSKHIKVAVVKLGHNVDQKYYGNVREGRNYRQYATKANTKVFKELIKQKGRIKDISFVPSILMPHGQGLRSYRDVAAMMQADVLLLIYTNTDADYDFTLIGDNEVKATATLESVAVDVRTGTIPFTSLATGTVRKKKADDDFSNEEFRRHIVVEAEDKAIAELAQGLGEYFN